MASIDAAVVCRRIGGAAMSGVRAWSVITALALVVVALPLPLPTVATAQPSCQVPVSELHPIERVSGADRFGTAVCAAQVAYPDGADHVVIARADDAGGFADALAGAVLAEALTAPLLLTTPDALPAPTRAELLRLAPDTIVILGGTAAVSTPVEADLAAIADVERIAGATRFDTAAAIAQRAGARDRAFIVNGFRPPDALVAAAPAARSGAALLLTEPHRIPAATAHALADASEVVIVGGYGVVPEIVEAAIRQIVGAEAVRRVSGDTRAATAASAARAFPADGIRHLVAGTNASLVDAVTAGWLAARPGGGPILYVERDRPGPAADRWLRVGGLAGAPPIRLLGGTAVLSDVLRSELETRYDEAAAGGPAPQIRGVWVHLFDDSLKSRAGIDAVLDAVANANLNTVVLEVSRRQDAYYSSAVLPRTADPALPGDLDVLAHVVPAAHDRGLEVHAWVPVLPAYHAEYYDGLDLGPDHVWVTHGPTSAEPWTTRAVDGRSSTYLDPGVPGVQDHAAAVLRELAAGYDIDAVHLDYLRYEGRVWGYHAVSLDRFARLHPWVSGTPAVDDADWGRWRRRQTHDLARRIAVDVAEVDPTVAVSMAGSTMGAGPSATLLYSQTRTYADVFQDWPYWLTEGAVDQVFAMNYFREANVQQRTWLDEWIAFEQRIGDGRHVAIGLGSYLNTVPESLAQIRRAAPARDGVVLFGYQQNTSTPTDPRGLVRALASTVFTDPAPSPALPWRDAPTTGHLRVMAHDGALVTATPVGGGADRSITGDATGRVHMVHLAPGAYVVTSPGYAPAPALVTAGQVAQVELVP
jgi:uncharacterized lipoprotein YddW (UPF0748 family)/putative cell wall-binding protein